MINIFENLPKVIFLSSFFSIFLGIFIILIDWIGTLNSLTDILIIFLFVSTLFGYTLLLVVFNSAAISEGLFFAICGVVLLIVSKILDDCLRKKKQKESSLKSIFWNHTTALKIKINWIIFLIIICSIIFGIFKNTIEIWFKYPGILSAIMLSVYKTDNLIKIFMLFYNFHVCESISGIRVPFYQTFFLIDIIKGPPFVFLSQESLIPWVNFGIGIAVIIIYLIYTSIFEIDFRRK